MASPGVKFVLSEREKELAISYSEESGFYKNRLAKFLGISRPTLDKLLDEDKDFFTELERADAIFCQNLIAEVARKDPKFILRHKYGQEFNTDPNSSYDPEAEMKRIIGGIEALTHNDM